MVTGNAPIRRSSLAPGTCFSNVILPLVGSSSPFWTVLLETVYYETCHASLLMDTFLYCVFSYLGLEPRAVSDVHVNPTITIIDLKCTRMFVGLDGWVPALKNMYLDSAVNVVDFAQLTLLEQVKLV